MSQCIEALLHTNSNAPCRGDFYRIANDIFTTPGFFAPFAARALANGVQMMNITMPRRIERYAEAIGLNRLLSGEDPYGQARINEGKTYSTLTLLDSADAEDRATQRINGCIRHIVGADESYQRFVSDLCSVVGEIHNNVWSHGMSTGISMAQKWKDYQDKNHSYLELALADCGHGFLRELKRVGSHCETHEEAISWCIQEGNSTKKHRANTDPLLQRMPSDLINNPIPGIAVSLANDNNHMGLGLYKLVSLVTNYNGRLWLASGNKMLIINGYGHQRFETIEFPWDGVALACRFHTGAIQKTATPPTDPALDELIARLRGVKNG